MAFSRKMFFWAAKKIYGNGNCMIRVYMEGAVTKMPGNNGHDLKNEVQ